MTESDRLKLDAIYLSTKSHWLFYYQVLFTYYPKHAWEKTPEKPENKAHFHCVDCGAQLSFEDTSYIYIRPNHHNQTSNCLKKLQNQQQQVKNTLDYRTKTILALRLAGWTIKDIAEHFGVSHNIPRRTIEVEIRKATHSKPQKISAKNKFELENNDPL